MFRAILFFSLISCVCLADKHKDSVGKMAETSNSCSSSNSSNNSSSSSQTYCICSVWGTASSSLRCSTERWVWERGTLLSVSRVAKLPLGRTRFTHYISCILLSILQKIVSSIKMIYELVYILIQPQGSILLFKFPVISHTSCILVSLGFCIWE